MNMVFLSNFKLFHFKTLILCNMHAQIFQESCLFFRQNLFPILDSPYHMIIDIANTSSVMYKICFHTHIVPYLQHNAITYLF